MAKFQPVIRKARFVVSGYTPQQMIGFATALNADIAARLDRGMTVNDTPAPALSLGYAKFKQRKYGRALRDWRLTGQTRGSMKVLSAATNKATLGFLEGIRVGRNQSLSIGQVVAILQKRSRQYGVSPSNRAVLVRAIEIENSPIKVQAA